MGGIKEQVLSDINDILSKSKTPEYPSSVPEKRAIEYSLDLNHLAAYDLNQFVHSNSTLDEDDSNVGYEQMLTSNIRNATQSIVNSLFSDMPTRQSDDNTCVLSQLPVGQQSSTTSSALHLPREKPLPKPREMTRWEKFAREKGINANKKRSALVHDTLAEQTNSSGKDDGWVRRFGYKGKQNVREVQEDWLIEVPDSAKYSGADVDMFAEKRRQKKEKIARNQRQHQLNMARGQQKFKA